MRQTRKRVFINEKTSPRERQKMIYFAVENGCNTVVFSMNDNFFKTNNKKYIKMINKYALYVEAGGSDLSLLVQKKLFVTNPELFRMEQGVRKKEPHFCPTNPQSTKLICENAYKWLNHVIQKVTPPRIFHLLPDKGHENTWCACPHCRAFSPAEQYLIAVNTFADVLIKFDIDAWLFYIDFDTEPDAEGISPKKNVFPCIY